MKFQVCPVLHYTKNARSQTLTITLTKAVTDADGKKAYDLTNCQSVGTENNIYVWLVPVRCFVTPSRCTGEVLTLAQGVKILPPYK